MAADWCDDLIMFLLFPNTIFQTSILIYCFLHDGTENEAVVSKKKTEQKDCCLLWHLPAEELHCYGWKH